MIVSNCLDPDQDLHLVGSDLGPNCLEKISADEKSCRLHGRVQILHITINTYLNFHELSIQTR